ncbi:hypothetical protein C2G38_2193772 [Gigaspora rosea]|uniref:Uncharacterized protein n=1 Tax=Gigaspora rosea TaxID=44941 RepID=A0A397V6J9_9GLOM|nr:hypothetical protein C2G38_2193772 [Gigaspora rosea]
MTHNNIIYETKNYDISINEDIEMNIENQQLEYVKFFLTNNEYNISAINLAAIYLTIFLCNEGIIVDKIKDAAHAKVIKNSSRSDIIMKGIKIDKKKNILINEILMKNSDFRPF